MDRNDIVGLPSGQVISVTTGQLNYLKGLYLVYSVPKYNGKDLGYDCFSDTQFQDVKAKALEQILDEITNDDDGDDGEYGEIYY